VFIFYPLVVEGKTGRGRGSKTWPGCVRRDIKELGLRVDDARNKQVWKVVRQR